jgi:beta-lactamase class D
MHPSFRRPATTVAAALLTVGVTAAGLTACTPRPDSADDVVGDFLAALADRDAGGAAGDTDDAQTAQDAIAASWDGLQAEGLSTEVHSVTTDGDVAQASYALNWDLPGDRDLSYDSTLTATKSGDDWSVRWTPSVLHPDLGADQHLELRKVAAQTADVVGSDGSVLLTPGTRWRVLVDTDKARDLSGTMNQLAGVLAGAHNQDEAVPTIDAAEETKEARQAGGTYSVTLLPSPQGAKIRDQLAGVDGLTFNEEPTMVRPDPGFAPDLMSRVNALVGPDLAGEDGWEVVGANRDGNVVTTMEKTAPKPSPAVKVSLSKQVQAAAQKAVDTRQDAQTMMVVMKPSTGELLAVAQTPEADKAGDLALSGQFPPGSTFKMITASAGLSGKTGQDLTPDTTVPCPATMNIGGRVVTNYNSFDLGNTSLRHAFAESCNTTFADLSTELQPGVLKGQAEQMGLGRNYDIPGLTTVTGDVPQGDVMLDRTESGYGQGLDLASPFGMALVAATAANGRTPVPTLVETEKGATTDGGKKAEPGAPLDPHVLDGLRDMMRAVVTSGSGSAISGAGEVYAKTGEAEYNGGSHAWFAGYRGDLAFATLIVGGGGSEHSVAVTQQFFTELDAAAPQ